MAGPRVGIRPAAHARHVDHRLRRLAECVGPAESGEKWNQGGAVTRRTEDVGRMNDSPPLGQSQGPRRLVDHDFYQPLHPGAPLYPWEDCPQRETMQARQRLLQRLRQRRRGQVLHPRGHPWLLQQPRFPLQVPSPLLRVDVPVRAALTVYTLSLRLTEL